VEGIPKELSVKRTCEPGRKISATHNTAAMLLQVLSAYGQVIKIKSINAPGITEIDVSNLATGIYYIKTDSGRITGGLVKQKFQHFLLVKL
jgi:hypothetical protein